MDRITVKNNLVGKDVKVREGNAGIVRELITLKPGGTYAIQNDPNATYREYTIITIPDNTKLRELTSDDFTDLKEISIFEENGQVDWMGTADKKPAETGLLRRLRHRIGL